MAHRILAGRYRLVNQLGEGGMGQVWEAFDQSLERPVAVKLISVLAGGGSRGDEARARFLREARLTARLQHPSIITVHDLGEAEAEDGTTPFLVMELLRGKGLDAVLRRGPVALPEASRWGVQICEALGEAHTAGILHRDIKPANILITGSGTVKVLDFGIARAADATATRDSITQTGFMVGTPQYMAPEHARGRAEQRSDLYALGCVLFEMITGRLPFEAPEAIGYLTAHLTEPPPAPSSVAAGMIPDAWDEVVLTLLRKEPDQRYDSATRVADELRRLESNASIRAPVLPIPRTPTVLDPVGASGRDEATATALQALPSPGPLGLSLATTISTQQPVADIALGPRDDRLALAQVNGTVVVTDLSGREELRLAHPSRWLGHHAGVAFSPDGTRLATLYQDRTLRLWDAATGSEWMCVAHSAGPWRLAFSPEGRRLATMSRDCTRLWNTDTGELVHRKKHRHLRDVAFDADGTLLGVAGLSRLSLVDVIAGSEILPITIRGAVSATCVGVAFSPDGGRLLTASRGSTTYIVDVRTGRELHRMSRGSDDVWALAFSPRGDRLVISGADRRVRIWDTRSGERLLTTDMSERVGSLAFSLDGAMLATASSDDKHHRAVRLWMLSG